jgi:hypothetical protein
MLQATDQGQAAQKLCGTPAGAFAEPGGALLVRVGPLTAGPLGHALLTGGTVARDRRREPGSVHRPHRDHGSHLGLGLTPPVLGTLLRLGHPLETPAAPRRPLHRTVRVHATPTGPTAVAAHGEPGGTQGAPLGIDVGGGTGGGGVFATARLERDDGGDGFGREKLGEAIRVEATVIDDGAHRDGHRVGGTGLEEAIYTGRPQREVGAVGWGQSNVHRQRRCWRHPTVLAVPMAEAVGVAGGIIPPRGRGIPVPARMVTAADAVGPAVTGGAAVGAGARGERGASATEHQSLEVTQEAPLDRGEHPTGAEEGFQPGEPLLGPGLVRSREQLLGQALGDRIGLCGLPGLRGVPVRLCLLAVALVAVLAETARAQAVGARWRLRSIFQPVKKGVEGADGGRLEGDEASDRRQARMGTQVVGPLRETLVVEQPHEQKGPEHTDGVVGRSTAWAWGIERAAHGPGRVQIEPQEHECGLPPPWLGKAPGLAVQPALELGGQQGTILGRG